MNWHMLNAFQFLNTFGINIDPKDVKIHFAKYNGAEDPLNVYLSGKFEEWQNHQSDKNFGRKYVLSLIQMKNKNRWLFAGFYSSCLPIEKPGSLGNSKQDRHYYYPLKEIHETYQALKGRLIFQYALTGRNVYRFAEEPSKQMILEQLLPEKLTFKAFPGYKEVYLSKTELDYIFREQPDSWKVALSAVSGIYVISDATDGRLYIGSASGADGFWGRWKKYYEDGHGDNIELKALLMKDPTHAENFRYSILEIMDIKELGTIVDQRETFWKKILLTRQHGMNGN